MSRLGMTSLLACCCLVVAGGLWLLWPKPLSGQTPLLVQSVLATQDDAADGQLRVTLGGQGFNSDVRVSLLPDIGNQHLIRGQLPFSGSVNHMVAEGDLLFLANAQDGLIICDVSQPDVPSVIASLPLPGMEWRVAVVDSVALVLTIERGLHLVDISDPTEPRLLSTLQLNGPARDMVCGEHLAYIVGSELGLRVVDFSNPQHPQLVGMATEPVRARGVTLAGDLLLVADDYNGLWRYQGAADGNLRVSEHLNFPGRVEKAFFWKRQLLVQTSDNLFLHSAGDEIDPQGLLGSGQFRLSELEFIGDQVFVGTIHGLLCGRLDSAGTFKIQGVITTTGGVRAPCIVNDSLFFGDGRYGLKSVPLTSVTELLVRTGFSFPDKPAFFKAVDDRLLVASRPSGFQVLDFKNQQHLVPVGRLYPELTVLCMAKGGGRLYLGTNDRQLVTLERKGGQLVIRDRLQLPQMPKSMVVRDEVLLVADDFAGTLSFSLSDPDHPQALGGLPSSGVTYGLTFTGHSAIIAEGVGGVRLADLLPDGRLRSRQLVRLSHAVIAVAIQDNRILALLKTGQLAFLEVSTDGRLRVISEDIGVPSVKGIVAGEGYFYARLLGPSLAILRPPLTGKGSFETVGEIPLMSSYGSLRLQGKTLFVGDMDGGARLFSLENPGEPQALRTLYPKRKVFDFIVDGDFSLVLHSHGILSLQPMYSPAAEPLMMGDYGLQFDLAGNLAILLTVDRLQIVDLQFPQQLRSLGALTLPARPRGIKVRSGIAYVACGEAGLLIIDVSDYRLPILIGSLPLNDVAQQVTLAGHLALVADGQAGLAVVDVSDPRSPFLHQQLELAPPLNEFSNFYDVKTDGKTVFVADLQNGLVVAQLGTDGDVRVVGHLQTHGNARQLSLKDNRLYIADLSGGVLVVDVSEPARPYLVGRIAVPGIAKQVQVVGENLLLLSGTESLFRIPFPVEAEEVVSQGSGKLVASFPRPQSSGFYTLRVSGALGAVNIPGAIRIESTGSAH